jgi:hemoglobin
MDTGVLPVTEDAVADLVARFYDRVRADDRLGPMFAAAIGDWDGHLQVMRDFWSAVLRRTARYQGCVMSAHVGMPIESGDFDRWLALFRTSAGEALPPEAAERAMVVAEAVTQRLRLMARQPRPPADLTA